MKFTAKVYAVASMTLGAIPAFAQSESVTGFFPPPKTLNDVFAGFIELNVKGFFPLLVLIALIVFLTGVVKFLSAGDNEESRESGRMVMTYGIITFFVIISVWGIVGILYATFFSGSPTVPNYLPRLQ